MKSRYMFDGMPPLHETDGEATEKNLYDMSRVPSSFVRQPQSVRSEEAAAEEQIGVALDERSFESLQRIARYLGIEDARECSRAELLVLIRQALS